MTQLLNKIIRFGLYGTLLLPLLFTSFTYFPWLFGKTVLFQMAVEILVFVWLMRFVLGDEVLIAPRSFEWPLLAFFLILMITAITGVNFSHSFWGYQARMDGVFTWLHFGVWYFLLIDTFKETNDWRKVLFVSVVVAFLVSLTVFFQKYLPATWQSSADGGIIGNRGFAASYFLGSLGLVGLLFALLKNKWRWLLAVPAFIFGFAVIFTGNRGALIALGVGVAIGVVSCLRLINEKKTRYKFGFVLLTIIALAIGVVFLVRLSSVVQRAVPRVAEILSLEHFYTATAKTRLLAWKIGWQGFLVRPLMGWGPSNFDVIFNTHFDPHFLRFSFAETIWDKPHNLFLELADGSGIFGVLSYLALIALAGTVAFKKRTLLGTIVFSTLAAGVVQNFFLFETSNSLLLFFLLLAFISTQLMDSPSSVPPSRFTTVGTRILQGRWVTYVYGVVMLVLLLRFNIIPLKSSYYLARAHAAVSSVVWAENSNQALSYSVTSIGETAIFLAERFTQLEKAGVDVSSKEAVLAALTVADVLKKQGDQYLNNPLFPVWAGQIFMILGEKVDAKYYVPAETLLQQASAIAPNKQEFLFFLGRLYLLKKDFPRALEYQRRAVELAPSIGVSHWFLGLSYIASGDTIHGLQEIETAMSLGYTLTAGQKLYVLDVYAGAKKYDKVIEGYTQLIASDPENVNWYIRLATAYALSGDKAAALRTAEKAVSLYPPLRVEADAFIKQYKLK